MSYVKCVVWDLDNTLWDGILLEDPAVKVREPAAAAVRGLDERGILQSIASRNDRAAASAKLAELGLADYFLYQQISWSSKAASVEAIAGSLRIGLDSVAFIDDDPFERDEVAAALSEVRVIDAAQVGGLLDRPEMSPRFVTADSRKRRLLYVTDTRRDADEEAFRGPKEEFLAGLGLRFTIRRAGEGDLARAEELTVRTHQLNATGYTYSYEDLERFRTSPEHLLLVADLEDRYGTYGTIGLALLETGAGAWALKLLLMSCRVMSRGVGAVFLAWIMNRARNEGRRLLAEFVANERNRAMYVTYRFAGFSEVGARGEVSLLEADLTASRAYPPHVHLITADT